MKSRKKGISVVALVASVAIIVALLTTVTISGVNTAHNAKKIAFGTEINMMQTALDAYYTKNNATFPVKEAVVLTMNSSDTEMIKQFEGSFNEGVNTEATLYLLDYNELGITSLKYGKQQNSQKDVYAVSKISGKVYYLEGIKIGGKKYYTLTDDIENLLNYNSGKNTVNTPLILFEPNTTEWAQSVNVIVKVPTNTYTNVSVVINDSTSVGKYSSDGGYAIYNTSGTGNYYISVNYTEKNGEQKKAKYTVTNVDTEAPKITVGDKVKVTTGDSVGYMKITSKSDNLSGIKTLKYDYGDFSDVNKAKEHFINHGVEPKDDIILIKEKYDNITLYIEDNSGNFNVVLLDSKI